MSNTGLGFYSTSNDNGRTWTTFTSLPPIVYGAPITVVPGQPIPIMLPYTPVHGLALYRDGCRLYRDDGTGIDFSVSGTTVTLAIAAQPGEVFTANIAIGVFGALTPSLGTALNGAFNAGNQTATVATGSSTTSFTSATQFANGTIFIFTSGANVDKTCLVTAVSGPSGGVYTYTVSNGSNTTGLTATPSASDAFSVAFTWANTPSGNVTHVLSGDTLTQGTDFVVVGNALRYLTVYPIPGESVHQTDFVY